MAPLFSTPVRLNENVGNNAFGRYLEGGNFLDVPVRIHGSFDDVKIGERTAFREFDSEEKVVEYVGLEAFVSTEWNGVPVAVFDNHNFALAFWYEALASGVFSKGATLAHIDMHSDLWPNENDLDLARVGDTEYVENFVNLRTSVGNYIEPAMRSGMFDRFIRIEGEGDLNRELAAVLDGEYGDVLTGATSDGRIENRKMGDGFRSAHPFVVPKSPQTRNDLILNLDLDFFAPDLDDVPFELKKRVILEFARRAKYITVATSPCFIDQKKALEALGKIFSEK
jgi:hypothetical protein